MKFTIFTLTVLAVLSIAGVTRAETNLAMACADLVTEGAGANVCKRLKYSRPTDSTIVIAFIGSSTTPTWALSTWNSYSKLPNSARLIRCTADIVPDVAFPAGISGADPCPATAKPWVVKAVDAPSTIQARFMWSAVSTYTDGRPIAATDHLGYELTWWTDTVPKAITWFKTGNVTSVTLTVPNMRICATINTLTRSGASDPSTVRCETPTTVKPTASQTLAIDFPGP